MTTIDNEIQPTTALSDDIQQAIYQKLATEMGVKTTQITAFVKLYDEGASIPFIARYRKEQTQGLDDNQLRQLEKSLNYERDMATRRNKILELLTNQGKLTDELSKRIANASSKLELEDIYLPYRPRRRSIATQAREAGLEPIALAILHQNISPTDALADYQIPEPTVNEKGEVEPSAFAELDKQLQGVGAIIIEEWTQELDLLDKLRIGFGKVAQVHSLLAGEEKREVGEKFSDYFDHSESLARLPNHRLLAMLRGRQENVLTIGIEGEDTAFIDQIMQQFKLLNLEPSDRLDFLQNLGKKLWLEKWRPHIEHRLLTEKRLNAEADAIEVFANNLKHLLMNAPAGQRVILGVDPGIRHGVKMAVVDSLGHVAKNDTGEFVVATVYPFGSENRIDEAKETIKKLLTDYKVNLIAIGNGTASRETDALIKEILSENTDIEAVSVVVNESGASVYSASELASQELSDLDVSIRGAVSIARRLQDPLSELVKVDPKAIGVGQYQHDVNQNQLTDSLNKVTQDCVNAVGVDVNTASPAILAYIAGLNSNVAQQIVNYRNEHGAFINREQLKNVPRLGAKTFEQSAGFLRIRGGDEPLDATGLHPENYALVKQWLTATNKNLADVLANENQLNQLDSQLLELVKNQSPDSEDSQIKALAIKQELAKPAHDPRPAFKTAQFRDDVNDINDLTVGMELEGVVTNVTAFGCFVDVGVHQDGLVHISELSDEFIADPLNFVKPGNIVNVRVISIDVERKRIGFSMKSDHQKPSKDEKKPQKRPKSEHKADHFEHKDDKANKHVKKTHTKTDKNRHDKPKSAQKQDDKPYKIGSFGALLQQAGLKK
ncbi:RNA-binding S1 domain-containing protein [Moraxella macacae 0408225]|uniref:RNA-binding S1 domain-containing protein n=1 Tax=Moraxella macacae 0408225 TaxID=1230338 RepID=L2F7A7_9GAMM|nr:Tex family protein [Moraxella macacae]ELA08917.1 RNA-binding S1 domain-containing protein [Moraxella macacae 0408225]